MDEIFTMGVGRLPLCPPPPTPCSGALWRAVVPGVPHFSLRCAPPCPRRRRASSLDDRHAALESSCGMQPHSGSPLATALAASLASPEPSPVCSEPLMPVRTCSRHSAALDIGARPGPGREAMAQR